MPIRHIKFMTESNCWDNPQELFVFGDNMAKYGRKGQAVIRLQPNSVGIPTKWQPKTTEDAYFKDDAADDPRVLRALKEAFTRIETHLAAGGVVNWPTDGVGTGLAQLSERAPRVAAIIRGFKAMMIIKWGLEDPDAEMRQRMGMSA